MASRKTSNQQRKRPECHTPDLTITLAVLLSLILASTFFAQIVLSMGEGKPELDILAFIFSIAAQLLMIGRFIENWVAWLCLNVFNIGLWTYTAITVTPTYSIAYMWLIFMGNCAYGCYRWSYSHFWCMTNK